MANVKITDLTEETTLASGDLVEIVDISVSASRKATLANVVSGGGGLLNVVEDTTPQLGGDLDTNNFEINNIKGTSFNETDDGNSGTADTIDWSAGAFHKSTLTDNVTYTFTDPFTGGTDYTRLQLKIVQDATGGRDITWPSNVVWPEGEPTWTDGTANQKIIVTFVYDDGDDDYIGQATSWYT